VGDNLRSLGEFGLIERLRERFGAGAGVEVGIGDDAALIATKPSTLVTVDMLVEGTHFDFGLSTPADAGFKAIACSASDIAAMGGEPRYAVVALGAAPDTGSDLVDGLADGIHEACREFGIAVAGGDTVSADQLTISVTVLGEPRPGAPVLRSGAHAGDLLCVTGAVGAAAAALRLHRAGFRVTDGRLLRAHTRGRARVREGIAAAAAGARAMIDVSDGLAADAAHLAVESRCGLVVRAENIPVADGVGEAASSVGVDALRLAATGGDDYELLVAVHPHDFEDLRDAVAPTPLTTVGEFTSGAAREIVWPDGSREALDGLGWDHYE